MARYLIGIDLGTTNSALAFIDLERKRSGKPEVQTFPIPQLVAAGEVAPRPLLPSFLYLPGPHDLPAGAVALPWDKKATDVVGEFARNHGAKVPGRLVSSAKSWLCNPGVDRTAALLPWGAPPDVPRRSPLEASARYLRHMVEAWNAAPGRTQEEHLEDQPVVLTVPASFDDVARNLTVQAAQEAGLKNVTLLEEPQSAFYCWLALHAEKEADRLRPGTHCLVVDVGGGTTDFSLIQCIEEQGGLAFIRQAVGDHLLLGGDNMDWAVAKAVEPKLARGGRLDAAQFGALVQACRQAKEALLAPKAPAEVPVTVMGRGRAVVGGTLSTPVKAEELRQILYDGFFPHTDRDSEPQRPARAGLHEMGLPYVADPAVTRHLAAFLKNNPLGDSATGGPEAILFNGGVFQPQSLRDRLLEVMRTWYPGYEPVTLTNPSLDLAVAWGAAYFGWLKHTGGRRIGGGTARSYYIAVADEAEAPDHKLTVLCVAPKHLEEGVAIQLPKPELHLALGQPVQFPLYTSTVRGDDQPGEVLRVAPDQLLTLPPLHTVLRGGKRSGTKSVPVMLASRTTEIGTLELYCVAREREQDQRWRLEFNVRDVLQPAESPAPASGGRQPPDSSGVIEVFPEHLVQNAAGLIRDCFEGDADPKNLTKVLESALEMSRGEWPGGLCRRLFEVFMEVADRRRRSPAHLARWLNLTGYCLRPGYGDARDRHRVEQLWKLFFTPFKQDTAVAAPGQAQAVSDGGADFWIMWRRVAGGLSAALQNSLFDRCKPQLLPSKKGAALRPGSNELAEMWRAAASLERLDAKVKEQLGDVLIKQVKRSPVPTYAFWALTRLGARVLLYGPLNTVLHPETVQGWLNPLLKFEPGNDSERLSWTFCLAQLTRRSGQRALDVDESHRQSVLTVLRSQHVPVAWMRMVEDVVDLEGEERSRMFGEALPIGLRLAQ